MVRGQHPRAGDDRAAAAEPALAAERDQAMLRLLDTFDSIKRQCIDMFVHMVEHGLPTNPILLIAFFIGSHNLTTQRWELSRLNTHSFYFVFRNRL